MIAAIGAGRARQLAAVVLVGLGLAHLVYHAPYTLDDAYITFRYARNLARGLGLVYNPGERVKGYSNTLYTLMMALPELLGGRDPIVFSKRIGALSFIWIGVLGYGLYSRGQTPARRDRGLWLLAFLAVNAALAVHFIGGLETGLYSALVFAAVLQRIREQEQASTPTSALLFVAVVLSRPEGILIFAAMALHDLTWRVRSRRFSWQDGLFLVTPALTYVTELVLSQSYYGEALPQTFYAKAGASADPLAMARQLWTALAAQLRPDSYLTSGLGSLGFGWVGLALLPLALLPAERRRQNAALGLALLAQLAFVLRAGGDWAPAFRFGVPLIPLFFVLWVEALGAAAAFGGRRERALLTLLALASLAVSLPTQWRLSRSVSAEQPVNARNKLVQGRSFAAIAPAGTTLSSFDIGGMGYAAFGLDILDTVGLTTRETTGCRDRMLPRCVRFAELVAPELVRPHKNRRRDAFVSATLRRLGTHIELDGGGLLLHRDLVLPAALPSFAAQRTPSLLGGAQLIADDIPESMVINADVQVTLFWTRESDVIQALLARRLEWKGAAGHYSAQATEPVWKRAGSASGWPRGALHADRMLLVAPPRPGRYELHLVMAGQRIVLATVDVLEGDPLQIHAAKLGDRATELLDAGQPLAAFHVWGRASQLACSVVRDPFHEAVVRYAAALRGQAEELEHDDPVGALRIAQQAKRVLHDAYAQSDRASVVLRHEIEWNAEQRQHLIAGELARF